MIWLRPYKPDGERFEVVVGDVTEHCYSESEAQEVNARLERVRTLARARRAEREPTPA